MSVTTINTTRISIGLLANKSAIILLAVEKLSTIWNFNLVFRAQ